MNASRIIYFHKNVFHDNGQVFVVANAYIYFVLFVNNIFRPNIEQWQCIEDIVQKERIGGEEIVGNYVD